MPWRQERLSTPVFWPGGFHGLCPWGPKNLDVTEQFSLHVVCVCLTSFCITSILCVCVLPAPTPLFLWLFAPCPLPLITTAFLCSSSIFQWAFFFWFPFFIKRPLPLTLHSAPLFLYRGSHLTSELPAASGPQFYSSHFFPLSGVPRPSPSHPNSFLSLHFLFSQY